MKTKIKKTATYSSLKRDTIDLFNLLVEYKGNEEMINWVNERIKFNIWRMLRILKNKDEEYD